jgi:arylsulfatase
MTVARTPFRGEKNEKLGGRLSRPGMIRWPGVVKPGTEINDIMSHEDWVPTLVAAAGEPNVTAKLLTGYQAAGKLSRSTSTAMTNAICLPAPGRAKRHEYFYWTDDGNLAGLRYDRWKLVFLEQRARGLDVWQDPLVTLRLPKLFDIRADPFERADQDSGDYIKWRVDRVTCLCRRRPFVARTCKTYVELSAAAEARQLLAGIMSLAKTPGSWRLREAPERFPNTGRLCSTRGDAAIPKATHQTENEAFGGNKRP